MRSSRPTATRNTRAPRSAARQKFRLCPHTPAPEMNRTLPLDEPTTCDTAYFGGIAIIMWTWSTAVPLLRCDSPSASPACGRPHPSAGAAAVQLLRRHFGITPRGICTPRPSGSDSRMCHRTLPFVCLAAHEGSLYGGHTPEKRQLLPPPRHSRGASLRASGVAPRSNTPGILGRRALPSRRSPVSVRRQTFVAVGTTFTAPPPAQNRTCRIAAYGPALDG